jgi:hypothetical protein
MSVLSVLYLVRFYNRASLVDIGSLNRELSVHLPGTAELTEDSVSNPFLPVFGCQRHPDCLNRDLVGRESDSRLQAFNEGTRFAIKIGHYLVTLLYNSMFTSSTARLAALTFSLHPGKSECRHKVNGASFTPNDVST